MEGSLVKAAEAAMKLVMLSWRDIKHPQSGGAEVLTHETLKRLAAAGHAVTWFAARFPGAADTETVDGVRVIRQGRAWTVQFRAWRWLRRRLGEYDRVVDQINTLPFMTPWYVPARQRRFFIMQLSREYWWRESPGLFRLLAPVGYLLEPWSLRRYRQTRGVTISESTKDDLVALGLPARNIAIIPMAITVRLAVRLPAKPGPPTVMILGRLTPAKFVEEGIAAFRLIQREYPQARLWIVGRGNPSYRRHLEYRVRRWQLRNVKFHGGVSEAEKQQLLRKAHLLVFTSHREGWGLIVNEAAAFGTPTVGYDVPGVRESIGESNQLAPRGDTAALATRALTLLDNRPRYDRHRRRAWQHAREMSYDRTAEKFLEAIK